MIVLGIVGSPAGGKSTVAARLQELGATWINADLIARDVLQRAETQIELIAHFGSEITDNEGRIDRAKLGSRVFGDDEPKRAALSYLESVLHPETRRMIAERLRTASESSAVAAVLDVPLLFESRWDQRCDEIWCVDAPRDQRLQRAAKRGWSDDELGLREQNQMDIAEKRRRSSFFILNDGSPGKLVDTIDCEWCFMLAKHSRPSADNDSSED